MKKFLSISLLSVIAIGVLFVWRPFDTQAEIGQPTRDYLHSQSLSDWVVMGLAAAGDTNFDLSYASSSNPQTATDYARTILAITAANQNPTTVAGRDWVAGLRNFFQNNQFGSGQMINDDIWAVLALRSAGVDTSDSQMSASKNFIMANQNTDGGWSYQIGLGSDSNNTAAAIMALKAGGLAADDPVIVRALTYLHGLQNTDGGIAYQASSTSDGASTAWVIDAIQSLGQDATSWTAGANNPISFLQSLLLTNGSYRWQPTDTDGSLIVTAYAAVALSNSYYPIRIWQAPVQPIIPQVNLRIETPDHNLCDATVNATSVLAALIAGADSCHYTLHVTQSALGNYVSQINDYQASGTTGWLYRLNWHDSQLAADQQAVGNNDQVLWFYGQFTDKPLRVTLDRTSANAGDSIVATVENFNGTAWQVASGTLVHFGNQTINSTNSGLATWVASGSGAVTVFADGVGYVRSDSQTITIGGGNTGGGSGVSQTVNLQVDLIQNSGGGSVAFQVSQTDLGFGAIQPGSSQNRTLTINNVGANNIRLTAQTTGDQFFANNLKVNDQSLGSWYLDLANGQTATVTLSLLVPSNSLERGHKSGQLIYWGQAR